MSSDSRNKHAWLNGVGLALLAVCYVAALANVLRIRKTEQEHDVIRLVHWQLELGVREGVDDMIRQFEAYKAEQGRPVKIIQIPMPERTYQQYVVTRLIGANAPDMIQIGKFNEEYLGRYFLPLSEVLQQPNPWITREYQELAAMENRSEEEEHFLEVCRDLKDRSWMDTFNDGLRTMFKDRFQEYYAVGFSQFTIRMFYNKRHFRDILGTDQPPRTYRELLEICERIQAYAQEHELDLTPIASSIYQMVYFRDQYLQSLTRDIAFREDLNLDGSFPGSEKLMAVLRGRAGPYDPRYRAGMEAAHQLARFFPRGFMSFGREDSQFAFVQGKASMITSGSWDAGSFIKKAQQQPPDKRFEIGVFQVPMIGPEDPEYGAFYDGPATEATTGTGFPFGLVRFTEHIDLCVEFLQFCTTPRNNTRLNRHAGWIPSVIGAKMDPVLDAFAPDFVGLWGGMNVHFIPGGEAQTVDEQLYWPYISGDSNYETYATSLMNKLPAAAARDFQRLYREQIESQPAQQTRRSVFLAATVFGAPHQRLQNERKLLRACGAAAIPQRARRDLDLILQSLRQETNENAFSQMFFEALQDWRPE